jgi:hypothetical protein
MFELFVLFLNQFLKVVFETLRRLMDYTPLPDVYVFLDPLQDAYEIASQKICAHVVTSFDGGLHHVMHKYNILTPSGNHLAMHCRCHPSLEKDVEVLKKQMASITEQVHFQTIVINDD